MDITDPALTFSIFASKDDDEAAWLLELAETKSARVVVNALLTGVGVSWSMHHGGPGPRRRRRQRPRWAEPVSSAG